MNSHLYFHRGAHAFPNSYQLSVLPPAKALYNARAEMDKKINKAVTIKLLKSESPKLPQVSLYPPSLIWEVC